MSYNSDNEIQIITEKEYFETMKKKIESKYPIPKVHILDQNEFFLLEKQNMNHLHRKRKYQKINKPKKTSIKKLIDLEKKSSSISINKIKIKRSKDDIMEKIRALKNKQLKNKLNLFEKKNEINIIPNNNIINFKKNNQDNINTLIKKINDSKEPIKILNNLSNKNQIYELLKFYILEIKDLLNNN